MAFIYQRQILIVFYAIVGICSTIADERAITTSVASMAELLEAEHLLVHALAEYASSLQNKLDLIHSALKEMKERDERARIDAEAYLANPLNAFALVRRLHIDWINWEIFLKEPVGQGYIENIAQIRATVQPSEKDLLDASMALHRLQEVYGIEVSNMASGLLYGYQYKDKLTALDCFTIGHEMYKMELYFDASYWLYAALENYVEHETNRILGFSKENILMLYAEALLQQNRPKDALEVINAALEDNPHDAKILRRKADIQLMLHTDLVPKKIPPVLITMYEQGCRGQYPTKVSNNLRCRYEKSSSTPFLQLAPLKIEVLNIEPYFVKFHDVLYDNEIEELKALARPMLRRATVLSSNETSEMNDKRTSKFAWFPDKANNITMRINQRIADMTGFDLNGSEMLQVMNYGLGGHYDTHYDFFNVSDTSKVVKNQGDRIATVLFYLNDVAQGGATVFPYLKVAVYPQKGSAVMWYNLNNKGEGDASTMHAACPVIVGSKWVCNKWIRERQQMFRKPCLK